MQEVLNETEYKTVRISKDLWQKLQEKRILKGYRSIDEVLKVLLNGSTEINNKQPERKRDNSENQDRGEQDNSREAIETFEIE